MNVSLNTFRNEQEYHSTTGCSIWQVLLYRRVYSYSRGDIGLIPPDEVRLVAAEEAAEEEAKRVSKVLNRRPGDP